MLYIFLNKLSITDNKHNFFQSKFQVLLIFLNNDDVSVVAAQKLPWAIWEAHSNLNSYLHLFRSILELRILNKFLWLIFFCIFLALYSLIWRIYFQYALSKNRLFLRMLSTKIQQFALEKMFNSVLFCIPSFTAVRCSQVQACKVREFLSGHCFLCACL